MENSVGLGFMTAFAVSGTVVLVALKLHKRLLSDFMNKLEFELAGSEKFHGKKKVRFADDVMEPSSNNIEYRKRRNLKPAKEDGMENSMPINRQVLYKGIVEYKSLKGSNSY